MTRLSDNKVNILNFLNRLIWWCFYLYTKTKIHAFTVLGIADFAVRLETWAIFYVSESGYDDIYSRWNREEQLAGQNVQPTAAPEDQHRTYYSYNKTSKPGHMDSFKIICPSGCLFLRQSGSTGWPRKSIKPVMKKSKTGWLPSGVPVVAIKG